MSKIDKIIIGTNFVALACYFAALPIIMFCDMSTAVSISKIILTIFVPCILISLGLEIAQKINKKTAKDQVRG